MFFQPRHYLEEIDVKVSGVWRGPVAAVGPVVTVTDVRGAPAHQSHLKKSRKLSFYSGCSHQDPVFMNGKKHADLEVTLSLLQKQGSTRVT